VRAASGERSRPLTPCASLLRDEWSALRAARHRVPGWRSGRDGHHTLHERLGALWLEWIQHDDDFDRRLSASHEFLRDLIERVQRLQRTPLMQGVARSATVPSELRRTNVLRVDARYRRIGELWDAFRFDPQPSLEDRMSTAARLAVGHDRFVRILVARALRDLESIAEGTCTARVTDLGDGVFELVSLDAPRLRVIPMLAATASAVLADLLPERDATVVVHGSAEHAEELGSVTRRGGMWFVATSPLDLHAVERVGHVIRTHVVGSRLAALPLEVELAPRLAGIASALGLVEPVRRRAHTRYMLANAPGAPELDALTRFEAASSPRRPEREALTRDARAAREAVNAAGDRLRRALVCPRPHCHGTGHPLTVARDRFVIECQERECSARWGMQACAACGRSLPFFTLQEMPELVAHPDPHGLAVTTSEAFGMTALGEIVREGDAIAVPCACGHRQPVSTARRS
jgi:hypothetical protein